MSVFYLDTNVIVRLFVQDQKEQAERVKRLFESKQRLFLTDNVVAECVYVLCSVYRLEREAVAKMMFSLVLEPNVVAEDKLRLIRAFTNFAHTKLSFVDGYLLAVAESTKAKVVSFDRGIDKAAPGARIEP